MVKFAPPGACEISKPSWTLSMVTSPRPRLSFSQVRQALMSTVPAFVLEVRTIENTLNPRGPPFQYTFQVWPPTVTFATSGIGMPLASYWRAQGSCAPSLFIHNMISTLRPDQMSYVVVYAPASGTVTSKVLVRLAIALMREPMLGYSLFAYALTPPVAGWSAQMPKLLCEQAQRHCGPAPLPQMLLKRL